MRSERKWPGHVPATHLPSTGHRLLKAPLPSDCPASSRLSLQHIGPWGALEIHATATLLQSTVLTLFTPGSSRLLSHRRGTEPLGLKSLSAISMSIKARGTPPFLIPRARPQAVVLSCGFLVSDFQNESEATSSAAASSLGKCLSKENCQSVCNCRELQLNCQTPKPTILPAPRLSCALLASLELPVNTGLASVVRSREARVTR